ncbi:MAG TPA: DNA polymerase III subunit gamma/tau C-terminal domain-containing protein, partial [Nitrosomonas sp.]|nr:DNA polymerase III subunit gamma/tau C-terminal domain-containing protein [Nitrosomonas sp.]
YYQIVLHGRHDLSLAPDDYAGFTMTLMRMLAFVPEQDLASFEYNADDKKAEPAILIPNAKPVDEKPVTHDSSQAEQWADSDYTSQQWLSIVKQLKLSGMAKMLAQHCEAKFLSEEKIALYVPELHKHLLEKRYQDRLKQALEDYFKKTIDIKFSIGTLSGMTVAAIEDQEKQLKQSQAIAAIEADPFVREVVENFDAKLIVSSIKPIN